MFINTISTPDDVWEKTFPQVLLNSDFVTSVSCIPDAKISPKMQNNSWHASQRLKRSIDWSKHVCKFVQISHLCNFCGSYYGCVERCIACVASVSTRVCQESWDESKKRNNRGGGRRGERESLNANPMILEICICPQTQLLIGAVLALVMLIIKIAINTSIKPGMFCLHVCRSGFRLKML